MHMLTPEQFDFYNENGYLLVEGCYHLTKPQHCAAKRTTWQRACNDTATLMRLGSGPRV
jgi:hypothetical protein